MQLNLRRLGRVKSRRKAVAGILAAIILFAAIFTVGVGFFLFVNSGIQSANQANISRANNQVQAGLEKLLVTAGVNGPTDPCANCVSVVANNTGGVSSSIIDIYVTCISSCPSPYQQGQLMSLSASTGSHFLRQSSDLSMNLPLNLGVGASTKYLTTGLAIKTTAFSYASSTPPEYVVVSLLTASGDVFSAQYPPPPVPTANFLTVVNVSANIALSLSGGGPQLSVLMKASPSQTFSCSNGCVTLNATVYNLASSNATGVTMTLNQPYVSGTASVTLFSACSPSSQDIPAGSARSFICKFSANTGFTGGLASFSGHATGTLSAALITSAEALSNSIEIGGLASVPTQGAFVANFFFLKYSSCVQNTGGNYVPPCKPNASPMTVSNLPSGSFLAGGSNFYTAFYMQITNVFNTTLPILQYSYTFGDPSISGEVYYFLAGSNTTMTNGVYYPNYAASTPTLVRYPANCNVSPTPSNCISVKPGQTVTLTFAACGFSATNWAWGGHQDAAGFDNSGGCTGNSPNLSTPEGVDLGIVVSFLYKGSIYSQLMPFEGQAYLRSAATSVVCSPSTVIVGSSTTCTATVTDTDGSGASLSPTGTVTFSDAPSGLGTFSPGTCTLSSGSCSVTYTPNTGTLGPVSIIASYSGNSYYMASSGSAGINVVHPTTTTVSCVPTSLFVNTATTCTVTVTDTNGSPVTPTGSVTFTTSPGSSGTFLPTTCTLTGGGASVTCTTQFTPSVGKEGSITVKGTYNGDSLHATSAGNALITAMAATSIAVSCNPSSVGFSAPTMCAATVSDIGGGTAVTATGTMTFSQSPVGSGVFTPVAGTCALSSGLCSVTFTPNFGTRGTVTINASYPGDLYHTGSGSSTTITVTLRTTSISVNCVPGTVAVNQQTTCTATVTDNGGGVAITPTGGTVTFSQNPAGSGVFTPVAGTCALTAGTCTVTFMPSPGKEGTVGTAASYAGDVNHLGSGPSAPFSLTVNQRAVTVAVSCNPTSVARGLNTAICTVTVTDNSPGTAITPTGTVSFAITAWTGSNSHRPTIGASCTLASGTCSVTFTSGDNDVRSTGVATITATYNGDTDHSTNTDTAQETVT